MSSSPSPAPRHQLARLCIHPFALGLFLAGGALTAFSVWMLVGSLTPILWAMALAAFFAIGLNPIVQLLSTRLPRPLAIATVTGASTLALAGIVLMIVPAVVAQTSQLLAQADEFAASGSLRTVAAQIQQFVPKTIFDVHEFFDGMLEGLQSGTTLQSFSNGVFGAGLAIASGFFFVTIVIVLTVYFLVSGPWLRAQLIAVLPHHRRYIGLRVTNQVGKSVSRYFLGQMLLAILNGVLSLIFLLATGSALPLLFAAVALLCALIPLIGIPLGGAIIVVSQALFIPGDPLPWMILAVWYVVYMALEAYVIAPRVVGRAVELRVVVVLLVTLLGGAMFGIVGAFFAVPAAVAIAIGIREARDIRLRREASEPRGMRQPGMPRSGVAR